MFLCWSLLFTACVWLLGCCCFGAESKLVARWMVPGEPGEIKEQRVEGDKLSDLQMKQLASENSVKVWCAKEEGGEDLLLGYKLFKKEVERTSTTRSSTGHYVYNAGPLIKMPEIKEEDAKAMEEMLAEEVVKRFFIMAEKAQTIELFLGFVTTGQPEAAAKQLAAALEVPLKWQHQVFYKQQVKGQGKAISSRELPFWSRFQSTVHT